MLLKLIPANSEPTIHFSLSFADLPHNLPTPASWTAQLSKLMLEDLEVPTTMHSLDQSAGVTCLLEEVAMDLLKGQVRCRFVDNNIESWILWDGNEYGKRFLEALENIIRDVKESTIEDERVAREREWEKQRLERSKSMSSATAPKVNGVSGKVTKHKKQRSFFMQIVSCVGSIINLSSPSTSNFPSLPFSRSSTSSPPTNYPSSVNTLPTTPITTTAPPPPGTSVRARALRRAARSALVDTYRQFVLSVLVSRLQEHAIDRQEQPGFCDWIVRSMRRRALERMKQLLEEAEAEAKTKMQLSENPSLNPDFDRSHGVEFLTTALPISFSDDEDEAVEGLDQLPPGLEGTTKSKETDGDSESDTETDGSSVHTPSTMSHYQCYPSRSLTRSSSSSSHSGAEDASPASSGHHDELQVRAEMPTPPVPPKDLPQIPHLQRECVNIVGQLIGPTIPPIVQHLSPASRHEYNELVSVHERLGHLLLFGASKARVTAEEAQNRLDILAVQSQRRAWANRALTIEARSNAGLGGSAMYGMVTPYHSSCLAKYSWTAEDLARRRKGKSSSPSSCSSDLPSRCSSRAAFPSYRPRLRPKIQYEVEATLVAEVIDNPFGQYPLIEGDFEMYEEMNGPSPLGGRARRHARGGTRMASESSAPSLSRDNGRSEIGQLFPVSEETEGEVQDHFSAVDEVFAFAARGRQHRNERTRTFMGCDEVGVEGDEEETEIYAFVEEDGAGLEDPNELDLELGFGEFGHGGVPTDIDPSMEMRMAVEMERPKITPRVRTTSMMGTFVQRTKEAKSAAFHAASHRTRQELTEESLLCQPVSASVTSTSPRQSSPPKLQTQNALRLKMSTSSPDGNARIKASRSSSPAIYTDIEVDLELEVQVRVSEYDSGNTEEFTLSMDLPREGRRKRDARRFDYPTRPLSRHEFDENRRPTLGSIFAEPPVFAP